MRRRAAPLRYLLQVGAAAAVGAVGLSVLRTGVYIARDLRPDMSPMMFIVFSPLLAAVFAAASVLIEFLHLAIRRDPPLSWPWAVGLSYCAPLLALIHPALIWLCLLLNPLALHLWIGRPRAG